MKYLVDHDLHIHSQLSLCSGDARQTPEHILQYAVENGLSTICLTDHFWDAAVTGASGWYRQQDLAHIVASRPLLQAEGVRFLFGCETDMDKHFTVGISPALAEMMDFVIVPTDHLHMMGFTLDEADDPVDRRAALYTERLSRLLQADLPFRKVGIAHLTCPLICRRAPGDMTSHLEVLDLILDSTFYRLFEKAAEKGAGIELNFNSFAFTEEDLARELRPYRIAADCGCRFYFGSDAHHPAGFTDAKRNFEHIVDLLELTEEQKFLPAP